MDDKYKGFLREIDTIFAEAIQACSAQWPADPTFEDYEGLAEGELYQLDPQAVPYAIYCLIGHFSGDTTYGEITFALESFINFLDVDDKNVSPIPGRFQGTSDQMLNAARLEQLSLVTKSQSAAISTWLELISDWQDDDEDVEEALERASTYWRQRAGD